MSDEQSTGAKFERAVKIMERLRAPGGCPWDREQTFDTIKPYTLEETYEVFEAIDNRDWQELPGELGDLLLQVLFYAEMARESGYFAINDVLGTFGTANHRFFHGPGIINTDFGLSKNTRITESMAFEVRAEFFNIFNHTQFYNPSGNISSSRFGLVGNARSPRLKPRLSESRLVRIQSCPCVVGL